MALEDDLRARLRKIEALIAGAGTPGERDAAEAARIRVRARLAEEERKAPATEIQFSLTDQWSRQLFVALCRRYGLLPYRRHRQRYTTVLVKAPRAFIDDVLWPEFRELDDSLRTGLAELTGRIIREAVFNDISEAPERE